MHKIVLPSSLQYEIFKGFRSAEYESGKVSAARLAVTTLAISLHEGFTLRTAAGEKIIRGRISKSTIFTFTITRDTPVREASQKKKKFKM